MTIAEDPHPELYNSPIQFGAVDTSTGEMSEGYIGKDGKMAYRPAVEPLPWWKRLLGLKPKVKTATLWGPPELIGTGEGVQSFVSGGVFSDVRRHEWEVTCAVYRESHLYTGVRRYWVRTGGGGEWSIDGDVYEKTGKIITL